MKSWLQFLHDISAVVNDARMRSRHVGTFARARRTQILGISQFSHLNQIFISAHPQTCSPLVCSVGVGMDHAPGVPRKAPLPLLLPQPHLGRAPLGRPRRRGWVCVALSGASSLPVLLILLVSPNLNLRSSAAGQLDRQTPYRRVTY